MLDDAAADFEVGHHLEGVDDGGDAAPGALDELADFGEKGRQRFWFGFGQRWGLLDGRFFIARLLYGRRRCVCRRRNAGAGGRFVCRVSALAGEEISENAGEGAIGEALATILVKRSFILCVLQAFHSS